MSDSIRRAAIFYSPEGSGPGSGQPPPEPPGWLTDGLTAPRPQPADPASHEDADQGPPSYDDLAMGGFAGPSPFANPPKPFLQQQEQGQEAPQDLHNEIDEIEEELTSALMGNLGRDRPKPAPVPGDAGTPPEEYAEEDYYQPAEEGHSSGYDDLEDTHRPAHLVQGNLPPEHDPDDTARLSPYENQLPPQEGDYYPDGEEYYPPAQPQHAGQDYYGTPPPMDDRHAPPADHASGYDEYGHGDEEYAEGYDDQYAEEYDDDSYLTPPSVPVPGTAASPPQMTSLPPRPGEDWETPDSPEEQPAVQPLPTGSRPEGSMLSPATSAPIPEEESGREIEAVQMPMAASDPDYQQVSVANLKSRGDDVSDYTALSAVASGAFPAHKGASSRESYDRPGQENVAHAAGVAHYVPPDLSPVTQDPGAVARRIAGSAWIVFSVVMGIFFALMNKWEMGSVLLGPAFLMGALLLVTGPWVRIPTILLALLYGAFFLYGGYDLAVAHSFTGEMGFGELSQTTIIIIGIMGVLFVLGNVVVLPGAAGIGRAAVGGVMMIVPAIALLPLLGLEGTAIQTRTPPQGLNEVRTYGSTLEGFTLEKPIGWGTHDWGYVQDNFPFLDHLYTEPNYFFMNRQGTMSVGFYLEDRTGGLAGLSTLLGRRQPTPLEVQVTAGLQPVSAEPDTFEFGGLPFEELEYQGTATGFGPRPQELHIILDKAPLGNKMLLIVLTRNAASQTTAEDADTALNLFFDGLQFDLE